MPIKNQYRPKRVLHPGVFLGEKLEEENLTIFELAERIGCEASMLQEILHLTHDITEALAKSLENELNIPERFWMNSQNLYNDYIVQKRRKLLSRKRNGKAAAPSKTTS